MALPAVWMCSAITSVIAIQQLPQQRPAQFMQRRPNRRFAGFQIQMPQPLAVEEDAADERRYVLFRFFKKCLRSFFFNCSNSF